MADTKTSRVEFTRIETGVLGNCRTKLDKINELADDIKERGLMQNLVVWHKRMRRESSTAMSATIELAEKLLLWAAGSGDWPDELPKPPEEDES